MTTKIVGSGLICLDIIYERDKLEQAIYTLGGSCGNVISVLSYLNFSTYPIIPHKKSDITYKLINEELEKLKVNQEFILVDDHYRIPIIIQENYRKKHKFKFKNPLKNEYLPKYKSLGTSLIEQIQNLDVLPDFYYFDRCNLSNLELAKFYKKKGSIVFFEPSKVSSERIFKECLKYSDIVKYSSDRFDGIEEYITTVIPVEIKTLGSKGVEFRVRNEAWNKQSAKKVKNLIDTSGCGDICSVGLIYYLKNNRDLSEENIFTGLELGQTMAAINCSFVGAKTFINQISSEEFMQYVDKFLSQDVVSLKNDTITPYSNKINIKKFFLEL
jgi:fructokinase